MVWKKLDQVLTTHAERAGGVVIEDLVLEIKTFTSDMEIHPDEVDEKEEVSTKYWESIRHTLGW